MLPHFYRRVAFTFLFAVSRTAFAGNKSIVTFLGGENGTVALDNFASLKQPMPAMNEKNLRRHTQGDVEFETAFVFDGKINPGLGAVFNNTSCSNCHVNDAIGRMQDNSGLFLKISVPGTDAHGGPVPVPNYGLQLQSRAVFGAQPECEFAVTHIKYKSYALTAHGTVVNLMQPKYALKNCYDTRIEEQTVLTSPRFSPMIAGLGLLEALAENDILAYPQRPGARLKGHPNYVWDDHLQKMRLGRFGYKAANPSILQQVNGALVQDMGVTTSLSASVAYAGQPQEKLERNVTHPVSTADRLDSLTFYTATVAMAAARPNEAFEHGKKVFEKIHCDECHRQEFKTVAHPSIEFAKGFENLDFMANQVIHPYTDLLLHDLGEGLADSRPEYSAGPRDWRTTPLWGRGLLDVVSREKHLLHDGRASNFTEAILWHEGEAETSKLDFTQLSKADSDALLAFLEAL